MLTLADYTPSFMQIEYHKYPIWHWA